MTIDYFVVWQLTVAGLHMVSGHAVIPGVVVEFKSASVPATIPSHKTVVSPAQDFQYKKPIALSFAQVHWHDSSDFSSFW